MHAAARNQYEFTIRILTRETDAVSLVKYYHCECISISINLFALCVCDFHLKQKLNVNLV